MWVKCSAESLLLTKRRGLEKPRRAIEDWHIQNSAASKIYWLELWCGDSTAVKEH